MAIPHYPLTRLALAALFAIAPDVAIAGPPAAPPAPTPRRTPRPSPQPHHVPPPPAKRPRPAPKARRPNPPPPHDEAWLTQAHYQLDNLEHEYTYAKGTRYGRALRRQIRKINAAIAKAVKENP